MTNHFPAAATIVGLALLATCGPLAAQAPAQPDHGWPDQGRTVPHRQATAPARGGSGHSSRQTAQAGFDPWHSKGHELDHIADKLNACMLHLPQDMQPCIDEAIRSP